ncbi:MAG TPA: hypothetical protein VEW93_02460 [Acidimicrobiales bacterium]|nr:hypothetical protein [Acidimicrobiales bacterium]
MEAFVGRVAGDLAAVAHAATVVVGDKLGLYGALATREVCTAAGFGTVRRAAETPFNMVLEVRR